LELNITGDEVSSRASNERKANQLETDVTDELEAGDHVAPIEEELDIIAEIGGMGQESDDDSLTDEIDKKSSIKKNLLGER